MQKRSLIVIAPLLLLMFFGCQNVPIHTNDKVAGFLDTTWLHAHYSVARLQPLLLESLKDADSYAWSLTTPSGEEQLVSSEKSYCFFGEEAGTYQIKLRARQGSKEHEQKSSITVTQEAQPYNPYVAHVYAYRPAPGQFVNQLPKWQEGYTEQNMLDEVLKRIGKERNSFITLGAFGGYVVFGFDHIVPNLKGTDLFIEGNAFEGSSEPGIVMVAYDANGNGQPDDEWFELAGSEYHNPQTIHNYSVTYYRPDAQNTNPDTYIKWTDNQGKQGYIPKNEYHKQNYYPEWIKEDSYTLSGCRLPNNGSEQDDMWNLKAFAFGYVDNLFGKLGTGEQEFDLSWAVDAQGNPVKLAGISFVKVYCAENQLCGWLGETSTEVKSATDIHIYNSVEK